MEKFADQNYYSQGLQTLKYEHSDEEYRDCKQREHQYRDEHYECDDREKANPYDPHEVDKWAHYFCLPMDVNNSVFKRAFTFEIATFKIHVDVFSATTKTQCPVVVHKPNWLPAIIAGGSFFHHVKTHVRSISRGYYTVSKALSPSKVEDSKLYAAVAHN